jgi:GT2 family glycosyltransferase
LKKGLIGHYGFNKKDNGEYDSLINPDYMTGCSMLIRRDVIEKAGLLCEDFFMFFEDTEYSARLKKNGYEIRYVPSSKVWHKVSRSIVKGSALYEYYYFRNLLWFVKLNSDNTMHVVFLNLRKIVSKIISEHDLNLTYYRIKGVVDFLRGKKGILH